MSTYNETREWLHRELRTPKFLDLLHRTRSGHEGLAGFEAWADVIDVLHDHGAAPTRKDEILRAIFASHCDTQDADLRTVLLTAFLPGLRTIQWRKRHWDPSTDEMWQQIVWRFLRVLCRFDPRRRPDRIAQKILNDTLHDLHQDYRREWARALRECAQATGELDRRETGGRDAGHVWVEIQDAREAEIRRLREHLDAGRIGEADFLLLVGTRVYGRSVADYARDNGLSYEGARKRRQRAEAAIRRHEEG